MTSTQFSLLQIDQTTWNFAFEGDRSQVFIWLALIALGMLFTLYYLRELTGLNRKRRITLISLRWLTLGCIACLFLEPTFRSSTLSQQAKKALFIVDSSNSFLRKDPDMDPGRVRDLSKRMGLQPNSDLDDPSKDPSPQNEVERNAFAEIENSTRLQRVKKLLQNPKFEIQSLLNEKIYALGRFGDQLDWIPASDVETFFNLESGSLSTDLKSALKEIEDSKQALGVETIIVFSDGRWSVGGDPDQTGQILFNKGKKIHFVGVGSVHEPFDLGLLSIDHPSEYFIEDAFEGQLLIKAQGVSQSTARVSIFSKHPDPQSSDGFQLIELWGEELQFSPNDSLKPLKVPFSIPPEKLKPGRSRLLVRIEHQSGEVTFQNNDRELLITAKKRDLWILLADGRPRWESRYLKNLFERDASVALRWVFAGVDPDDQSLKRGEDAFPETVESLEKFDVIFLGDITSDEFTSEELQALRDHVDVRGGGLIFFSGSGDHLTSYLGTPLEALLPIRALAEDEIQNAPRFPIKVQLTPIGREAQALRLTDDALINVQMWELLRPLTIVSRVKELPGSEVWARVQGSDIPLIVTRTFGRGKILYLGTDQTWRWRYRFGDRYHHKIWGQLVSYIREESFAAEGNGISLDTDSANYEMGQSVRIRARLRNPTGASRSNQKVQAILFKDGNEESLLNSPLKESPQQPGLYSTTLPGLEQGWYELKIQIEGEPESEKALSLPFQVLKESSTEDHFISWNEEALREAALHSGGEYFREEQFDRLMKLLKDDQDTQVSTQSYKFAWNWTWFFVVVFLLSIEWVLRKRFGLL